MRLIGGTPNDQVGKIGKYGHRLLIIDEEMVVQEILFYPLFYHIAIIEPAEETRYASQALPTEGKTTYIFTKIGNLAFPLTTHLSPKSDRPSVPDTYITYS